METPINQLLPDNQVGNQAGNQVNASANFERPPDAGQNTVPVPVPIPTGAGQGSSFMDKFGSMNKKELFGAYVDDFKSTIVVFVLLLLGTSGVLNNLLKSFPAIVSIDGKTTILGAVIISIVLSLLFVVIKIAAKI